MNENEEIDLSRSRCMVDGDVIAGMTTGMKRGKRRQERPMTTSGKRYNSGNSLVAGEYVHSAIVYMRRGEKHFDGTWRHNPTARCLLLFCVCLVLTVCVVT